MQDSSESAEDDLFEISWKIVVERVTVVKFEVDNRGFSIWTDRT